MLLFVVVILVCRLTDRIVAAGSYVAYNCGASGGITQIDAQTYRLSALGLAWSADHFCQMIRTDVTPKVDNYTISASMFCTLTSVCHAGFVFNWVDSMNYEFVFIRTHQSVCMRYGSVTSGLVAIYDGDVCSPTIDAALASQVWLTNIKLEVYKGKARLYYGPTLLEPEWSTTKTGSKVGTTIANGFNDVVEFRELNMGVETQENLYSRFKEDDSESLQPSEHIVTLWNIIGLLICAIQCEKFKGLSFTYEELMGQKCIIYKDYSGHYDRY